MVFDFNYIYAIFIKTNIFSFVFTNITCVFKIKLIIYKSN